MRARPAPTARGGHDEQEHALEAVVDVHAFIPADLERHAQAAGFDDVQVRGEELLANWFGWFNRTLEASAEPEDIPWGWIQYAYRGYILLQRVDRTLLEPRLPPRIFYNLMLAARKPDVTPPQPEHPPSPVDILRDKRAIWTRGSGPIAFVIVYAISGSETAAIVAVGARRGDGDRAAGPREARGQRARRLVRDRTRRRSSPWRTGKARDLLRPAHAIPGSGSRRLRGLGADPPAADGLHRRRALPRRAGLGEAARGAARDDRATRSPGRRCSGCAPPSTRS